MPIPTDPNAKLRRTEAAAALTEAGYPITGGTLNKMGALRTGPPFTVFGRWPVYTWSDLLAWAQARTKSQAKVKKGAGR